MATKRKRQIFSDSIKKVVSPVGARGQIDQSGGSGVGALNQWIKPIRAFIIIVVLGLCVFSAGLANAFQGDDGLQITNNPVVHSISNILLFFQGGTFYSGGGSPPLIGIYYRPLMTTVFSLVYTLFGSQTFYFHLLQLLLHIGSVFLLFLFFRYSFKPVLSLGLALIFLIHPLNSQVVFGIPSMQDSLCMFFGILGLWLALKFESKRSLILVAASLFLALLSKESGILFIIMVLIYLRFWDRRRFWPFVGTIVLPVALWIALKMHAVGVNNLPQNAPIDRVGLGERLLTVPSILALYITKFVFPWKLSSEYYWVVSRFSVGHFVIPLLVDLVVIAAIVAGSKMVKKIASPQMHMTYLFFAAWAALGFAIVMQVVPFDFTASEPWCYFPMVGVLGMIGVVAQTLYKPGRRTNRLLLLICSLLIVTFGARSNARAYDWRNEFTLANANLATSSNDYVAYNQLAIHYSNQGDYVTAEKYASKSVAIFPNATNECELGSSLGHLGKYSDASNALHDGLKYERYSCLYDNLAALAQYYGNFKDNQKLMLEGTEYFPNDFTIWYNLSALDYKNLDFGDAKIALAEAARCGNVPPDLYRMVMQK